jgi:4-hydroxybenzoate polyprenyltransferase
VNRESATRLTWGLLNSRIHISILPVLLTLFWQMALPLKLSPRYYLMVMANTMAGYLTNLVTDQAEDSINYPRRGWVVPAGASQLKLAILACWVLSLYLALRGGWRFVLFGAVLNFFGNMYGSSLRLPGRHTFRVKAVPWLKNGYSAALWAVGVIVSPYMYTGTALDVRALLAGIATFFLVFFVELLWDVRDIRGDLAVGVRTIPICLGESRARQGLHAANILSSGILVCGVLLGVFPAAYWIALPHAIIVATFIEWYFERADRQSASHLYLLYTAGIMFLTLALSGFRRNS